MGVNAVPLHVVKTIYNEDKFQLPYILLTLNEHLWVLLSYAFTFVCGFRECVVQNSPATVE